MSWLLTSTDRRLRDSATEALYRFGRRAPRELFEMTTNALEIDDAYVPERLLAASHGVIMANQQPLSDDFDGVYGEYLRRLGTALRGDSATQPTSHWLLRAYARGAWEMATALRLDAAATAEPLWEPAFTSTNPPPSYSDDDGGPGKEVQRAFRMDFENYTVGSLYEDRSNYDRTHEAYSAGLAESGAGSGNSAGAKIDSTRSTAASPTVNGAVGAGTAPTASTATARSTAGSRTTNLLVGSTTPMY